MSIRILTVDDHSVVRQGLRMFLALDEELEVVGEAADGAEAVQLAHELQPDVVLMDLLMPGTDGYEVCSILKEDESTRRIPIIMLSAKAQVGDDDLALISGADSYITKPYESDKFLSAIRKSLGEDKG
jgi:CheY-like chemotaxis protein